MTQTLVVSGNNHVHQKGTADGAAYVSEAVAPDVEEIAASQTAQVCGTTGAVGDYMEGLFVVPETLTPGTVILLDDDTEYVLFVGGADSVSNTSPQFFPWFKESSEGAWSVTTGANVHVFAHGRFT